MGKLHKNPLPSLRLGPWKLPNEYGCRKNGRLPKPSLGGDSDTCDSYVLGPAPTECGLSTAHLCLSCPNVYHTLIGHPHQGQPQVPKASQLIRETALQDRPLLKFKWNYNSLLVAKNTWGKFNWALKKQRYINGEFWTPKNPPQSQQSISPRVARRKVANHRCERSNAWVAADPPGIQP